MTLGLTSCGGDDDPYEQLFEARNDNPNRGTVMGVWGAKRPSGTGGSAEMEWRIRLTPSEVVMAGKCFSQDGRSSKIMGFHVPAEVNETLMVLKEYREEKKYITSGFECTMKTTDTPEGYPLAIPLGLGDGKLLMGPAEGDRESWDKYAD